LWVALGLLLLALALRLLPACGTDFGGGAPWLSYCPPPEPPRVGRADLLRIESERTDRLRARLHDLRTRIALASACPAPPEPEPPEAVAEVDCPPGEEIRTPREVVFVLDGSQSMLLPHDLDPARDRRINRGLNARGPFNTRAEYEALIRRPGLDRIDVARRSLVDAIRSAPPIGGIGLISFFSCDRIEDYGRFGPGERRDLIDVVRRIEPHQGTPLARAILVAAGRVSGGRSAEDPATMVVVTDGGDSCDGNPCAVAARLARQRPGLRINVLDLAGWTGVECIAERTGGQVYRPGQSMDIAEYLSEAAGYSGPQACAPAD
jgi:Mg-chelatase subunit ChlD